MKKQFLYHAVRLSVALGGVLLVFPSTAPAQSNPQLPQVFIDTTYASPGGRILQAASSSDFQAALNSAQPGDIIELRAGTTFTGNFTLPNKSGSGWIYVRSSAYASLPPPGTRISPAQSPLMPKIVTPNTSFAIGTAPGAHHYRFVGIEITTTNTSTNTTTYNLVWLEAPNGQTSLSQAPNNIVFDRCYIHGTPTGNVRRGIAMNSAYTAVIDSYFSDFHEIGVDSQALLGWNGPGPFKIVNNYLEGAGENILFGGGDPAIPNLVPSDIEIRRNRLFKPLSWRVGDPSYAGIQWSVKNIFELKNARRVLVEGNILENNWAADQNGYAVLFTVRNQYGGAPWAMVQDVTFINNIVRHTGSGVNILGWDSNHPSQQTKRILIKNNLFDDVNGSRWGGSGRLFQLVDNTADVTIDHNTAFHTENILFGTQDPNINFVYRNNIAPQNQYGVAGTNTTGNPILTLNTYAPGGVFMKNAIVGASMTYPSDSFLPAGMTDVGFVDLARGNYRLAASSPYKNSGTDGKDIGADFDAIEAAINDSTSTQDTTPPTVPVSASSIEAEDFNNGGEGVAYHDMTAGNAGGLYRLNSNVDIISSGTGYAINNIQTGEWLSYTINVSTSGLYRIEAKVSSEFTTSRWHAEIDGVNVTGPIPVPNTGSWQTFQFVGKSGINLTSGVHFLKLYAEQEYFNFDSLRLVMEGQPPKAESLTPVNITTAPGVTRTFAAIYYDPDGFQNLTDATFYISGGIHNQRIQYNPATKTFTFAGVSGNCKPGQATTLSDGFLTLNCSASDASGSGTALQVIFSVTPQLSFSGVTHGLAIAASDQTGANNGKMLGSWTVK